MFYVATGFRVGDGFDENIHIFDAAKSIEPGPQYFWPGVVGDQDVNAIPVMFSAEVVQIPNSQTDVDLWFE